MTETVPMVSVEDLEATGIRRERESETNVKHRDSEVSDHSDVPVPQQSTRRVYWIDWLRVIAIIGVFFFHTLHIFDQFDFHVKNNEASTVATIIVMCVFPFGMPLFFFIAGSGSFLAMRHKKISAKRYFIERTLRLGIPFVLFSILLSPPQLYLEWLTRVEKRAFKKPESYVFWYYCLYSRRISHPGPIVFGWLGIHLWFLGFLYAFSMLSIPLFTYLLKETSRKAQHGIKVIGEACLRVPGLLFLFLFVPCFAFQMMPGNFARHDHDWTEFLYYLTFFIMGFVFFVEEELFTRAMQKFWVVHLIAGILAMCGWAVYLGVFGGGAYEKSYSWGNALFWFTYSVLSVTMCLAIFGLASKHLVNVNAFLRYTSDMVLPFFVVHQPIILAIAFGIVSTSIDSFLKWLIVVIGGLVGSVGFYEVGVRRWRLMRAMFGLKNAKKNVQPPKREAKAANVGPMW